MNESFNLKNWPKKWNTMIWRLPVVRHLRATWYFIQAGRHARFWESLGFGNGYIQQTDLATIRAIWRGES